MENRSFDHMLGWMKKLNPNINGVGGSKSNPLSTTDPNSPLYYFQETAHYVHVNPDPSQNFKQVREQVFGSNDTSADLPPMNGFPQQACSMDPNKTRDIMNGFDLEKIPVYKALVSEFAVFDWWFSAVPSCMQPNRLYVHSSTSYGAIGTNKEQLAAVFNGPNGVAMATSEYEHSSIPATVKNIFNLLTFLTNRDAWAGSFDNIVQTRQQPITDCPVQLPTPIRIRQTGANEDAKLTEFQKELVQLATVLKGDGILTGFVLKGDGILTGFF
ncbi:hypothetical protein RHSIM_Rhsim13G0209600 [Rhododendron simsii]|uniref:Uncharacterized protein n=1 Tax=Rhododendron simsii TaxID=118357 RepID=A0A834L6Z2_RHOSS|nr:hypothetical protein RHSIM_Rhsim13G0209600 [Rhododendron simsii]